MTQYERKLDSWQWRQRAYRIKERDRFTCQTDGCESRDNLHVHHLKYTTPNPWDEPGCNLTTVCDRCHYALHREAINGGPVLVAGYMETIGIKTLNESRPDSDKKLQAQIDWARNRVYKA